MNGKVLFIIHDLYQPDVHFPLGTAYLASMLEKYANAEVFVYDQAIHHQSNSELAQFLDNTSWDLIGVSFLAARYVETVKPLLEVISKHKKDAWLVVGGHGPAPIPEFILKDSAADIVAIGEAEETIVELLDAKINNNCLAGIKGIAYKDKENGKNIIINEQRPPIKNLDQIPFPAWHLFDMPKYTTALNMFNMEEGDRIFGILTSRGCVGRCSFCYRMHKGIRLRSINNVIEEIKILKDRYGVNYFLINDELFLVTKKRLFEFRDALQEHGLTKLKFICDARVDFFDMEVAKTLKEMGCQFCNIGFESMDQKVLDLMNKRTTVEQNIRAAEIARKAKLSVGLNILWGCPGDNHETLKKGVEFIKKFQDYSQIRTIRFLTPYPGCPDYYRAIQSGLLLGADDFFKRFKNSDLITVNFTDMDTREMYKALYRANYELLWDYHVHAPEKLSETAMNRLIDDFYTLFFLDHNYKFRGARHYSSKEERGEGRKERGER